MHPQSICVNIQPHTYNFLNVSAILQRTGQIPSSPQQFVCTKGDMSWDPSAMESGVQWGGPDREKIIAKDNYSLIYFTVLIF